MSGELRGQQGVPGGAAPWTRPQRERPSEAQGGPSVCPGLQSTARSKAEQPAKGPLLILLLGGDLGEWLLTRFACWASIGTAPFGHCTTGHLDVFKAGDLQLRGKGQIKGPCGLLSDMASSITFQEKASPMPSSGSTSCGKRQALSRVAPPRCCLLAAPLPTGFRPCAPVRPARR